MAKREERYPVRENECEENSWKETRALNPTDMKIRNFGFRIRQRPRGREAIWEKHGEIYTQTQVLDWISVQMESVETEK